MSAPQEPKAAAAAIDCLEAPEPAAPGEAAEDIYPVWSPDGAWIAFTGTRRGNIDIYRVRPDGRDLARLTSHSSVDAHPAWSPDGRWLSFDSQRDGNREGYVMTASGCDEQNLTDHQAGDGPPAWAPDGASVVFDSDRSGADQIHRATLHRSADGRWRLGAAQPLTTGEGRNQAPSWSPRGDAILFESRRDGNRELYVMNADGSAQRNVSRHAGPDFLGRWSADGEWIAFWSLRHGNEDVYVVRRDGRDLRRLTDHPARDRMPAWAPDGQRLVFSSDRTGVSELYVMRRDGTGVVAVTSGR